MLPQKMMKKRDYLKWIKQYKWSLVRAGGGDWKLLDEVGNTRVLNIIITHPGGEVPFVSIQKTKKALQLAKKE